MGDYLAKCPKCVNATFLTGEGALIAHIERVHSSTAVDPSVDKVSSMTQPEQLEGYLDVVPNDAATALQAAATVLGPVIAARGLDTLVMRPSGGQCVSISGMVTALAGEFVAWLRKLDAISVRWVAIEDDTTGEVIRPIPEGAIMALILTGQRGRAVIDATDSRGFPVDATLAVKVTDAAGGASNVATAEIVEATSGTASGKDELVVRVGEQAGSALVTVYAPADDTIFGSVAVDVAGNPDDVTHIALGELAVEDDDTTEPTPAPEPGPTPEPGPVPNPAPTGPEGGAAQ